MAGQPSIRTLKLCSARAVELYVSAEPAPGEAAQQSLEMYSAAAEVLRDSGARILQERVFFAPGAADAVAAGRAEALGELDDGVPPALLHVSPGAGGAVAGAQLHAIVSEGPPEKLELEGRPVGRIFRQGGCAFITVSGLAAPRESGREAQAREMLEKAEQIMKTVGGDMFSVARTWMWLADMLDWYDEFNEVRNEFFRERGLLDASGAHKLPASTGIGASPAGGEACAMDMVGAAGEGELVAERLLAGGEQGAAVEYGSAFSRALRAGTPAGDAVYVSGTAAIDPQGRTEHVGDGAAQIDDTISHVRAVLNEMGCGDGDVVQAVAYCKDKAVEEIFRRRRAELGWPCLTAVCDICRDDLLFEVEAAACPGAVSAE